MLLDEIKARMFQAMKSGKAVEREILRVAVGEITTDREREGRSGSDDEARAILKKIVKSNEESLALVEDATQKAVLLEEVAVLSAFLPKSLGVEEIVQALAPVHAALKNAGNDGQATGVAMKHLKAQGLGVSGKDVAEAVKRLRT
jgi:uncharacterized protein YqeY